MQFDTGAQGDPVQTSTANRDHRSNPRAFPEYRQEYYMGGQRTQTNIVRVRNNTSIHPWDGSLKAEESLESTFRVFHVQMCRYFRAERYYDARFVQVPNRAFHETKEELNRQHGYQAVKKAQQAYDITLEEITAPYMVEHLAILGSPCEAWVFLLCSVLYRFSHC